MRLSISSCTFILFTLLFSLIIQENYARKINNIMEVENSDHEDQHNSHKNHHQNQLEPELNVFFVPTDLKIGKIMPIYFSKKDISTTPKFLPKEDSEKLPFTPKKLPLLLDFFSIPKDSPQAKAMKYTLDQCNFEPMEGETKFCATSLESLFDFANSMFGPNSNFKFLTTKHVTESTIPLQNYTITKVNKISVPNAFGCHPMPYPYAVFYCHTQKGDANLYEIVVEGENGGVVEAAAICHMDTSKWDADHVAFRVLNTRPGKSPVCHFFPPDNLVLVPTP
ncbi:BURP domain protein USPL1-like [Vicia villosa]|uniref:BURP domain protein USPL1-like n=1 Tax=Vicia villosa TaxID=3911 RepID=UPI00273C1993|nr:BURP domain protein USPL1-like [Vicia villosa]